MRQLLVFLLLATTPLAFAQPPAKPTPEQEKATAQLNQYFRRLTKEIADKALADVKTLEDWQKQRPELRRQLFEMLGLWPNPERTDLKATITGTVDAGDFVVEKLHFQSRPKLYVTANFYRPKVVDKALPTILYACGHGTVKIDGLSYGTKAAYQHHAAWFARQGYCCLILDTLQLGEIEGEHHGTYRNNKWWWISRGYTPAGVEAWNCIRALDYLETRPEVDKTKIGMTGRSGGGAYTWWTCALDDRVACLVPVAGITDLENHVCDGCIEGHCDCMYMINTYQWDFATVAALAAPRPLLISNTDKDNIFPLNGVYRIHEKVKRIYDLHKAGDKLGLLITEGGHKDTQELQVPAFRWFNRFLMNKDEPITGLADKPLDPKQLKVFDKLPEDQLNTTVDEWFVPVAKVPPVPKTLAEWEKMREGYLKDLKEKVFRNWPKEPPPLDVKVVAEREVGVAQLSILEFASEKDIRLRLFVARNKSIAAPTRLKVLVTDDNRFINDAIEALTTAPGAGDSAEVATTLNRLERVIDAQTPAIAYVSPRDTGGWDMPEQKLTHLRRRYVLLGRTETDGRVWDVRRALAALREWGGKEIAEFDLQGGGHGAAIASFASCFELSNVLFLNSLGSLGDHPTYVNPLGPVTGFPSFLNAMRFIDLPQVIALSAPKQTYLTSFDRSDFAWLERTNEVVPGRPMHVSANNTLKNSLVIETEWGEIEIELYADKAPHTTFNFLYYVIGNLFDGGVFHRTVTLGNQPDNQTKIEVIQAGINPNKKSSELFPIKLERTTKTGLKHLDGSISMARNGPDTATSDFFICIGDQPELDFGGKRNPDGQGFAAFGRVTKGMDVVRKIQQSPAEGQKLSPAIKILRIRRK